MALLFLDHGWEERFERPEVAKRIDLERSGFTTSANLATQRLRYILFDVFWREVQ